MNTDKYTDRDWEELASRFSDEPSSEGKGDNDFSSADDLNTENLWRGIGMNNSEIDIDKAWNKLHDRLDSEGLLPARETRKSISRSLVFYRIAAAVALLVIIGTSLVYINMSRNNDGNMLLASSDSRRNIEVLLPDGSRVWLNRNSELKYPKNFSQSERNVVLTGEAFFDIKPDASKPFIIDADGKATVKVVGTSFNVITSNSDSNVEVLVSTGKVLLADNTGKSSLLLVPGNIGRLSGEGVTSEINQNRNYMAWKTDTLVYEGEKLDAVFSDLKRAFNVNIETNDLSITENSLTTTFFKLPEDTIIQVICNTFNLQYRKEGNVYHLSK